MARQRASQAQAAFARVGTAPVSSPADDDASVSASGNDVGKDGLSAAIDTAPIAGVPAVTGAGGKAGYGASGKAGGRAVRTAGKKAGKASRRVGRPRGPERVALTVRILAATNDRLTTAVETTGQSPQYVVDAALAAYLDALGV
jgi:hypothetical protein